MKTSQTLRQEFIAFFEEKGHRFVRSSPVVPQDDPTLLFTNAGMNQFKDVFLGVGSRDYSRAVNSQKCIRASGKHNDLEDVGRDNYHHTFFEMLGNWSFGDYFKREAIAWAWELLVERWKLPAGQLYATVFGGEPEQGLEPDLVAEQLWPEVTGIPPERVLRYGRKDNFWEMGEVGPCGPCSEIHMDLGPGTCPLEGQDGHHCAVNTDGCWRFVELWNLVFMQFDRQPDGNLKPLPACHVDTGMGLERITRVLQGVDSNYDTDLFTPLIATIEKLTGVQDGPGEVGVAIRVVADHLRALTFALADGALPSNEGRGYVLRRMLRRAARFGRVLGMSDPFVHRLVPDLVGLMGGAFPELAPQADHVARVIKAEETSFSLTLDRGLELFEETAASAEVQQSKVLPGADVFRLYDTYGFPVDLTQLMAEERGLTVDMARFEELMAQQRAQARAAGQSATAEVDWVEVSPGSDSAFEGYETLKLAAHLRRYAPAGEGVRHLADGGHSRVPAGERWLMVLDRTPFYPEGGGQVADRGWLRSAAGEWRVTDVRREGDRIVHVAEGNATPAAGPITAEVEAHLRTRTTLNHTATHLMHAALRQVLGAQVNQAGSVVHPDHLRFDYTHFEKPSEAQLEDIEKLVNAQVRRNTPTEIFETAYQQAIDDGVVALFGEKYGDRVRVVRVPGFSQELCGGCHVRATGDIGTFKIISEGSIAAGVRRIVAYTGEAAERFLREQAKLVEQARQILNVAPEEVARRLEQLLDERREMERELKTFRKSNRAQDAESLLAGMQTIAGVGVVAKEVDVESLEELRGLADAMRKRMKNAVAVMGTVIDGKGSLLCVVSDDLVKKNIKAGDIVNRVAALAGGRGGGPPHMATAGAKVLDKLPAAMQEVPQVLHAYLSQVSH